MKAGDNQHSKEVRPNGPTSEDRPNKPLISQKDAAKKLGVSHRSVKRAAAIKRDDPEIFKEMKAGKIKTGAAEKKIKAKKAKNRSPSPQKNGHATSKPAAAPAAPQINGHAPGESKEQDDLRLTQTWRPFLDAWQEEVGEETRVEFLTVMLRATS
jgi:hypothetical protein